jgi:AcrR family transcriptional regulator
MAYHDTVMKTPQRLTREAVLATAEQLLSREGPQGLSVRRIADALGVSRQIVYSRFQDKPDLVRALHAEGFRRLDERLRKVPAALGALRRALAVAHAYRASALASPALYGLMFGRPVMEFEPDPAARRVAEMSFGPVVDASRAWLVESGRSAAPRPTLLLAKMLWSATHGVVSLELAGHLGAEAPAILERVVRSALDR